MRKREAWHWAAEILTLFLMAFVFYGLLLVAPAIEELILLNRM